MNATMIPRLTISMLECENVIEDIVDLTHRIKEDFGSGLFL